MHNQSFIMKKSTNFVEHMQIKPSHLDKHHLTERKGTGGEYKKTGASSIVATVQFNVDNDKKY